LLATHGVFNVTGFDISTSLTCSDIIHFLVMHISICSALYPGCGLSTGVADFEIKQNKHMF